MTDGASSTVRAPSREPTSTHAQQFHTTARRCAADTSAKTNARLFRERYVLGVNCLGFKLAKTAYQGRARFAKASASWS